VVDRSSFSSTTTMKTENALINQLAESKSHQLHSPQLEYMGGVAWDLRSWDEELLSRVSLR